MAKIRRFNISHFKKVQKMVSSISPDEKISYSGTILGGLLDIFQDFMPLALRKSPESYIVVNENNDVKAFITIEVTKGNKHKWFVKQLFLDKNSFDEGKQLIGYVVAKYGALGADTFCVLIDENDETSAELFSKRCGFRLCSREVFWHASDIDLNSTYKWADFCKLSNFEAKKVADFYNDAISPHFRFSLELDIDEFKSPILKNPFKKYPQKFVLKNNDKSILAYLEYHFVNQTDFLVDLIVTKPFENEYLPILKTVISHLKELVPNGNIFVLNRNYMTSAKSFEDVLYGCGFEKTQIKMLLVKDFYKPLKTEEPIVNPAVIFNEITPAFMLGNRLQKSD